MKKIIIANWKLNGNKSFIKKYSKEINKKINNFKKIELSISPPTIYLYYLKKKINKKISLTCQNIDINLKGPFTGETSILMIKDLKIKYIIIGHSERRINHNENNKNITKKIIISKKNNIIPIICIGENINNYINKKSIDICKLQIKNTIIKNKISTKNIIIAYEPIWSIGTGKIANIKHIIKICKSIKKYIYKKNKEKIKFIYGGSINYKNANEIINNNNIDGLLIGNSSLKTKELIKILKLIKT